MVFCVHNTVYTIRQLRYTPSMIQQSVLLSTLICVLFKKNCEVSGSLYVNWNEIDLTNLTKKM